MASHAESVNGTEVSGKAERKSKIWVIIVFVAAAVGLFVAMRFLPIGDYLMRFVEWCNGLGVWAPIVVVLAYVAACILFLPGSVFTVGSGFIFGVVKGAVVVSIGSTLGASAAFLVGRTIARKRIEKMVEGKPKFAAIDRAVEKEGFKFVFLTRLSPLFPFNLLNYAFGLTKVPFWKYVLGSWIGMLPATIVYVYVGSGLQDFVAVGAGAARERTTAETVLFWVGLAITVVIVAFVTRIARRALRDATPEVVDREDRGRGESGNEGRTEEADTLASVSLPDGKSTE
jgi:uncharacterized membrane protein YdjX (TVP38/TMEM64 family)